jgi:hypothetical protein
VGEIRLVQSGEGVLQLDGDALGEAGGQSQRAALGLQQGSSPMPTVSTTAAQSMAAIAVPQLVPCSMNCR